MAGDTPTTRTRIYVALFAVGLLAFSGWVGWLIWLAIRTGRFSVRSGIVSRTDQPIRFTIEMILGASSVVLFLGIAIVLLGAAIWPGWGGPLAKRRRRRHR